MILKIKVSLNNKVKTFELDGVDMSDEVHIKCLSDIRICRNFVNHYTQESCKLLEVDVELFGPIDLRTYQATFQFLEGSSRRDLECMLKGYSYVIRLIDVVTPKFKYYKARVAQIEAKV